MENRKGGERSAARQRRKNWSEDEARKVLCEQAASGESVRAFARRRGLWPQRLWWWQKRLAEVPVRPPEGAEPIFLPVTVRAVEREAAALELGGGLRVELRRLDETSAVWVAAVVRALGAAS